jgi:NADPH:quinone reductase-like Zn-dependent oxidoreductase
MTNKAAYQKTYKSRPISIEPAPMPSPKPHQIVIRTRAIGINPADAAVQNIGMVYDASKHPLILGFDVAGEVYAVGAQVTRFKPGDRVCAFSIQMTPDGFEGPREHGAMQLYCVASQNLAAKVPGNVSFSEAAVFPSCLTTAAYALYVKDAMALDLPPIDGRAESNGKVLVVWGGSSVVGSCAIQMAALAGYVVVATSSPLNFEHCRALGAESVFDYKSPSVVEDIVAACKATGKESAGAFVAYFNDDSTVSCSQIVSQSGGSQIVGTVVPPHMAVPEAVVKGVRVAPSKSILHVLDLPSTISNEKLTR